MRTWPALEIRFQGDSDPLQVELLDYDVSAIEEAAPDLWRVFFATDADRDAAARRLPTRVPGLSLQTQDVPDEDWAARSQAALRAVRVGRIIVAPPWDVPAAAPHDRTPPLIVVIQPSTGFGTGHHATTRLCLAALQGVDVTGRRVIDVGTGSGVLALAAAGLGAAEVVGLDEDEDALRAARENLSLNAGAAVTFAAGDIRSTAAGDFDLALANLTGALLIRAAGRLQDVIAGSGQLILSGFLTREDADVRAAYAAFAVTNRTEEDEWGCITLQRR